MAMTTHTPSTVRTMLAITWRTGCVWSADAPKPVLRRATATASAAAGTAAMVRADPYPVSYGLFPLGISLRIRGAFPSTTERPGWLAARRRGSKLFETNHRPGGSAVAAGDQQRQAQELAPACRDVAQVQPLHDDHAGRQKRSMHGM